MAMGNGKAIGGADNSDAWHGRKNYLCQSVGDDEGMLVHESI